MHCDARKAACKLVVYLGLAKLTSLCVCRKSHCDDRLIC